MLGDVRLQCLVLAHVAADGWQPAAALHDPAPRDSAPDGVVRDREVCPGQPVAKVSEYVQMVRGLRADLTTRKETLAALVPDRRVDIEVGPFSATLGTVLDAVGPIDFAFVDGDHGEVSTRAYCRQLLPRMRNGGVLVFDDIRWSDGMLRAWRAISAETRGVALDLSVLGILLPT